MRVVTASDDDGRVVAQSVAEAGTFEHLTVEPDDDGGHRAALAFDQSVRGEGGAHRHQLDVHIGGSLGQHGIDRTAHADRQVVVRRG